MSGIDPYVVDKQVEEAAAKAGTLLRSKFGIWSLAGVSFVESALIVPLVTDPFLAAYVLADRQKVWRGVIVTTLASLLGGIFAFFFAWGFFEVIERNFPNSFIIDIVHSGDEVRRGTFTATLIGAFTPLPYTLVAYGTGLIKANVLAFITATIIGRGARYMIVGWLTYRYGEQALDIARRRIRLASAVGIALVVLYVLHHFGWV